MRWAQGAVDRSRADSGVVASRADPEVVAPEPEEPGNLLGRILVDQGRLRDDQIAAIVDHARKTSRRFGDAAIDLKLISRDDLEHALAAQFEYPFLVAGQGGYPEDLVAAYRPFSPKGQALRNLRTRLLQQWNARSRHALAVVSSKDAEGRSYIASNLAVVFSQLGERTLIVDADLFNARQHRMFNVPNDVGLSAVLVGRMPVSKAIVRLPLFRGLSIIPAGAPPPNAAELLGRKELRQLVGELKGLFDILIFDTSAANVDVGAELVAAACGSAIMVVRQNRSLLEESESLANSLRGAGVDVVGSVVSSF
jgi:protein-tyrosine kinase